AFQKIAQYNGDVAFGAWLKKIVINKCLDTLKSKKTRPQVEEQIIIDIPVEETNWEVEDTVSIEEIKKVMLTLPDKYKRVLMLYLIEGYNHEEIAQILDITIITSRSQLRRGKQKLKTLLKHQYYGSGY
ncbi:MAG: RNA polymerase sigma factor (sigma-70 family), partial [Saprospiraceae bacterium]